MSSDCDCSVCAYSKKHPQLNAPRCWHVTADTITDEQIRELLASLKAEAQCECGCGPLPNPPTRQDMRACFAALSTSEIVVSAWTKETARARCAELINARAKESR